MTWQIQVCAERTPRDTWFSAGPVPEATIPPTTAALEGPHALQAGVPVIAVLLMSLSFDNWFNHQRAMDRTVPN